MRRAGLWEETLTLFFSDNGGNVWEGARNYPLRGGKQSAYEGGSRVPAFFRMPDALLLREQRRGTGGAGGAYGGLMHVADVMPTLLALVDGKSEEAVQPHWSLGHGYDLSAAWMAAWLTGEV